MKILISAYGCVPGKGSEIGVGWNLIEQVAQEHECWVITNAVGQPMIEEYLSRVPLNNAHFIYVEMPKKSGLVHYFLYILWQVKAFQKARELVAENNYDLVHHLTYNNSWQPTGMGWLGIPFIWSAGSKDKIPWQFLQTLSLKSRISEITREIMMGSFSVLTGSLTAAKADVILTREIEQWPSYLPVKPWMQIGLNEGDIEQLNSIPARTTQALRVASIGRLLGWKGFALGIRAFAKFHQEFPNSEYWIIGTGPEKTALETLAKELNCSQAVCFWGELTRGEVLQRMAEVDLLLHPSLHDLFGMVLLEALGAGRPVVCLDIGGPSFLVNSDCGIKVAAHNPQQAVEDLTQALLELANNPEVRLNMGAAGRIFVRENWSWNATGAKLLKIYQETVEMG